MIAAALMLLPADDASAQVRNLELARVSPCPDLGTVVTVIARKRELWLCRDGSARGPFAVALGRGGVDKHREGDGRTPLGMYPLGEPRASEEFGTFIPIGYPTPEQAAEGYTGKAVGIHGPPRGQFVAAHWTTAIDWTLGCIATGDDIDLALIVDFVRDWQPMIVIR